MKKTLQIVCSLVALATLLIGCATTTTQQLTSSADFDKVFAACKQSAVMCGYGVTSASATDGFITASQSVVQGKEAW